MIYNIVTKKIEFMNNKKENKVVLLVGGFGTRLAEKTSKIPKPMVTIGDRPILWHIMKIYSHHGFNNFILCLGYKGYVIKDFFVKYRYDYDDLTINSEKNLTEFHNNKTEDWKITLAETGLGTGTGARLKKIKKYLDGSTFMVTYGDALADVDINKLLAFHKKHGKLATITTVRRSVGFGVLKTEQDGRVMDFSQKPEHDNWTNGGFFVFEPEVLNYMSGKKGTALEDGLQGLIKDKQLMAYYHRGQRKTMDMLRDRTQLEEVWDSGKAFWKVWS